MDGARDTTGDVESRRDRLAGETDLAGVWRPPQVDRHSAGTNRPAKERGELGQAVEAILAPNAAAPCHDDIGFRDVHLTRGEALFPKKRERRRRTRHRQRLDLDGRPAFGGCTGCVRIYNKKRGTRAIARFAVRAPDIAGREAMSTPSRRRRASTDATTEGRAAQTGARLAHAGTAYRRVRPSRGRIL